MYNEHIHNDDTDIDHINNRNTNHIVKTKKTGKSKEHLHKKKCHLAIIIADSIIEKMSLNHIYCRF